ncbi:MAG: serine/threonine-protein kinase, partial [Lachnospiraceae bacterium]|nr:serine/threonine-protein kinase [Lachnospiraceae bacterium]
MDYKNICINCMHEKKDGQNVCSHCGFDMRTYVIPSYVLPPFTILNGKYLVGKVQGIGGFGITYLAMDLMLEHPVAIKEYYVQSSMYRNISESSHITLSCASFPQEKIYKINREKFEKEAKTLASLSDLPGIVRVTDFFLEFNTAYIVMEYLSGRTLKQYVMGRQRLSLKETREMLNPIMTSLQYVHDRNILHRDISPDNMKVLDSGLARGQVKLYDFGGARQERAPGEGSKSAVILKKDGYTPIEQIAGTQNQGPWTDVYAMAATIYYCICGKPPASSNARVAESDSFQTPGQLGVPIDKKVEAVLLKALAVQPQDRYQSMKEFQAALENAGWGNEPRPKEKIWPFIVSGCLIAAAGIILLAAELLQSRGGDAGTAVVIETEAGTETG